LLERHGAGIAKACEILELETAVPKLETLAQAAGMSPFHFHRVFKAATGVTPRAYAAARRSMRTREALVRHDTVTAAIYESGFNSNGRFYATSGDMLGMSPRAFRAGGAGETIRFVTAECSFGWVLVAATAKGVCAIALGDAPGALVEDLRSRYSKAMLLGEDATLRRWLRQIIACVDEPARGLTLPLDVRGTAFQLRVWQALSRIPAGSTATYSEIAKRIGAPGSARAVARACASNTLAIAIPCHRVIAGDGGLAGYRWGLEKKKALLEREAQPVKRLRKRGA
jgi:AraC family transcriptional regulator of adaptative response/methylated-DNA-[protein]-cysteine methyltransferase